MDVEAILYAKCFGEVVNAEHPTSRTTMKDILPSASEDVVQFRRVCAAGFVCALALSVVGPYFQGQKEEEQMDTESHQMRVDHERVS